MGDGLERGLLAARTPVPNATGNGTRRLPSVIVMLSDGKNTSGNLDPVDVARQAKAAHIPIFTIALGTPGGRVAAARLVRLPAEHLGPAGHRGAQADRRGLGRQGVHRHRGRTSSREIYAGLGTRLSSRTEKHEVTAAFAGRRRAAADRGRRALAWPGSAVCSDAPRSQAVRSASVRCTKWTWSSTTRCRRCGGGPSGSWPISTRSSSTPGPRPDHEPARLGPRARRRLRGPVAQPPARRPRAAAPRPGRAVRRVRDAAGRARRPGVPARRGPARVHGAGARARRWTRRRDGRAARAGDPPRAPAHRDDAAGDVPGRPRAAGLRRPGARRRRPGSSWWTWPAGPAEIGAGPDGFAYDNERPRHTVDVAALRDRAHAGDQRDLADASPRAAATSAASGGRTRAGRGRRTTTSRTTPGPRPAPRTPRSST